MIGIRPRRALGLPRRVVLAAGDLAGHRPDRQLRAAIALFYSLLDKQQRRLYAGLESFERGHGGTVRWPSGWAWMRRRWYADVANCWPVRSSEHASVGSTGGAPGRKKTPDFLKRLDALLQDDTAGGPMGRRRRWTGKRLRQICAEPTRLDSAPSFHPNYFPV